MDRRSFLALTPAFSVGAVTAAIVLREDGKEDVELDVSVLKAEPGDVLVLSVPGSIAPATASRIEALVEHRFPTLKAMVLADGMKLDGVIRGT